MILPTQHNCMWSRRQN